MYREIRIKERKRERKRARKSTTYPKNTASEKGEQTKKKKPILMAFVIAITSTTQYTSFGWFFFFFVFCVFLYFVEWMGSLFVALTIFMHIYNTIFTFFFTLFYFSFVSKAMLRYCERRNASRCSSQCLQSERAAGYVISCMCALCIVYKRKIQ